MASFREAAQSRNDPLKVGKAFSGSTSPIVRADNGETLEETSRGQFRRGFDKGSANLKTGAYNSLRAIGDKAGLDGLSQFGAEGAERVEEGASALPSLAQPSITDVDDMSDVLDWAMGGLGQVAPSLIATAGGALAGAAVAPILGATTALGAGTGAFLASASPEFGHAYDDIEQATGEKEFWTSLATGAAIGAIDMVGFNRLVKAGVPQGTARRLLTGEGLDAAESTGIRNIAGAMVSEGATEATQELVGNVGRLQGGMDIDPLSEEALDNYINAAALGALAGGTIGAAGTAAKAAVNKGAETLEARSASREVEAVQPGAVETRELDETTAAEIQKLGLTSGDGVHQSRAIDQLREAIDAGTLKQFAYRKNQGAAPDPEFMETVEMAVSMAEKIRENPDQAVPPDVAEFVKAIFTHPSLAQFMPEAVPDPDTDAIYDEAVNTSDLEASEFGQTVADVDGSLKDGDQTTAEALEFDPSLTVTNEKGEVSEYVSFLSDEALEKSKGKAEAEGGIASIGALQTKAAGIEASVRKENPVDETGMRQKLERERGDTVAANIAKLDKANPDFKHEAVSLRFVVEQEARGQAESRGLRGAKAEAFVEAGLQKAAEEQRERATDNLKGLYDEASPAAFLDNYSMVRRTARTQAKGLDSGSYTKEDLQIRSKSDEAKAGKNSGGLIYKLGNRQDSARAHDGMGDVLIDGVAQQFSAINLVFKELNRGVQKTTKAYVPSLEAAGNAFLQGMGNLLASTDKSVQLPRELHPGLVIWRQGNKEIVFSDLTKDYQGKLRSLFRKHDRQMTFLLDTLNLAK